MSPRHRRRTSAMPPRPRQDCTRGPYSRCSERGDNEKNRRSHGDDQHRRRERYGGEHAASSAVGDEHASQSGRGDAFPGMARASSRPREGSVRVGVLLRFDGCDVPRHKPSAARLLKFIDHPLETRLAVIAIDSHVRTLLPARARLLFPIAQRPAPRRASSPPRPLARSRSDPASRPCAARPLCSPAPSVLVRPHRCGRGS